MHVRKLVPFAVTAVGALLASSDAAAQRARNTAAAVPASCPAIPRPGSVSPANAAEAARLRARGQEAAILGDPREARRFFARAVELNPTDARSAYQLARAAEQTGDSDVAVREYCRFLTLTPRAAEAQAVRDRLGVLTRGRTRVAQAERPPRREPTPPATPPSRPAPRPETQQPARTPPPARQEPEPPRTVIRTDTVVRGGTVESPPARARDTAVVEREREARPERQPTTPTVTDAEPSTPPTTESPDVFTGPRPASALLRGLVLPGLGQHHTGRTGLGVAVLSAAGAAAILAYTPRDVVTTETYTDPFGKEYEVSYEDREYPYWSAGIAAAIGVTVLGAAEAYLYAKRHRRAVASESLLSAEMARRVTPTVSPSRGGVDVGLSVRF